MKPKIIIFSGSRADFGLLKNITLKLKKKKEIKTYLIFGSQHFSKKFSNTFNEAKNEKIFYDYKINYKIKDTNYDHVISQISTNLKDINHLLKKINPDMCLLLGDRYEVYAFALCCYIKNIRLAHIHGGELTEGSFDDGFRHSISKFSNIHFVSHSSHKKRLVQLGENPKMIFNFGAPGAENALNLKKNSYSRKKNILITYHSQTKQNFFKDLKILNNIFKLIKKNKAYYYVFTNSNSDPGGIKLNKKINLFCSKNKKNCKNLYSKGHNAYLELMKNSEMVIGNSSSGIIEASTLQIPCINIGDRQKARTMSNNIINCDDKFNSLEKGFQKALKIKKKKIKRIFYKKNTSLKISNILINVLKKKKEVFFKKFYDIK